MNDSKETTLFHVSFLVHVKTDEPVDFRQECMKMFNFIESDGRFEVLASRKNGGGLFRPTQETSDFEEVTIYYR